jgi:hypothetical protein
VRMMVRQARMMVILFFMVVLRWFVNELIVTE